MNRPRTGCSESINRIHLQKMADSAEEPRPSSRDTSAAAVSPRASDSPALSAQPDSSRLDSESHLDHQGHPSHTEPGRNEGDGEALDDSSDKTDLTEKETQDTAELGADEEVVPEVRDGVADEKALEAGLTLEKSRTSKGAKSQRDPNLVTWDSPEDPENPKNWSFKRKWAATFVGKWSNVL